jgi:hypothetical protein
MIFIKPYTAVTENSCAISAEISNAEIAVGFNDTSGNVGIVRGCFWEYLLYRCRISSLDRLEQWRNGCDCPEASTGEEFLCLR